jgi:hypothetical protein
MPSAFHRLPSPRPAAVVEARDNKREPNRDVAIMIPFEANSVLLFGVGHTGRCPLLFDLFVDV